MSDNTTNWDLESRVPRAQGSLVLPTAPEGRIVMQRFSEDEWISALAGRMPVEMLRRAEQLG